MTYDDTDPGVPPVDVEVHEGIALVTSRTLSGTQQLSASTANPLAGRVETIYDQTAHKR